MKGSTVALIGIGVAALGAGAYFLFRNKMGQTIAGPGATGVPTNGALLQQPSQQYPYAGSEVTRQDTASQPWYGGARPQDASQSIIDPNLLKNVGSLNAVADATKSITSIWNDLGVSNWFSDDGGSSDDPFSANFSWS